MGSVKNISLYGDRVMYVSATVEKLILKNWY